MFGHFLPNAFPAHTISASYLLGHLSHDPDGSDYFFCGLFTPPQSFDDSPAISQTPGRQTLCNFSPMPIERQSDEWITVGSDCLPKFFHYLLSLPICGILPANVRSPKNIPGILPVFLT